MPKRSSPAVHGGVRSRSTPGHAAPAPLARGHGAIVKRGWLIAFEGVDGCGKSTHLALLAAALRAAGLDPLETREPTAGAWGQRIRAMARSGEAVAPEEELRWFVEDRREHVARTVAPALAAGRVVLTDRYFLSTVCYQGARGLDPARLLEQAEAEFPLPDLALLFEIDPDEGLRRTRARGDPDEPVFEESSFLRRVAANFRALDRPYLIRIETAGEVEQVAHAVRAVVRERLGLGR